MKKIVTKKFIVLVLVFVVGIALYLFKERFEFYQFDHSVWMEASKTGKAKRYYMAKYLIDHNMLMGISYEQVLEKLGTPIIRIS
jgi:hypothetical protein